MKRISAIAAAFVLCISAFAQDGRAFYDKYSSAQGVSAVYISPAMFRLLGHLPSVRLGGEDMDLRPVITSLSGMYVLSSTNPSVNDRMYRDITKHIKNNRFELLMEVKDNGEMVRIFTLGDKDVVTNFVLYDDNPYESNYICIDGNMPRAALEALIARVAASR